MASTQVPQSKITTVATCRAPRALGGGDGGGGHMLDTVSIQLVSRTTNMGHHWDTAGSPPRHHRDSTETPPGQNRDTTDTLPGHHRDTTRTTPGHHQEPTITPPRHHLHTTETPPGHLLDTTETPPRHHRDTTATPPAHHQDTTGTPPSDHLHTTETPSGTHPHTTGTPPGHHVTTIGTPPEHPRDTTGTPQEDHRDTTGTPPGHHRHSFEGPNRNPTLHQTTTHSRSRQCSLCNFGGPPKPSVTNLRPQEFFKKPFILGSSLVPVMSAAVGSRLMAGSQQCMTFGGFHDHSQDLECHHQTRPLSGSLNCTHRAASARTIPGSACSS